MIWSAVAAIALAGLAVYLITELVILHFRRRKLRLRETRMTALGVLSQGLAGGAVARLWGPLTVGAAATAGASLTPFETGISWPWWILGFVVYEFFYWLQHWAAHKVRALWCIHSPHHAPGGIHMLIGANHSLFESVFYFPLWFGFVPALFGVHPAIAVAVNLVDAVWGSFLHISDEVVPKGRYGVLERFLQTPAHHRVHHGTNVQYLDRNHAGIFIVWDRLLGTFEPEDAPVSYGLTKNLETYNPVTLAFHEWLAMARDVQRAKSWRDRVGYLLGPPGWSPDGSTRTAREMRAALEAGAQAV